MSEEHSPDAGINKAPIVGELERVTYPSHYGRPGDGDSLKEARREGFDYARAFLLDFFARHPTLTRLSPRYVYVTDLDAFGVPKHLRGWARVYIKYVLEQITPARLLDTGAGVSPSKSPSSRGRTNEILADPRM